MSLEKYPKTIRLRNKKDVILRPMTKGDGDALLQFFKELPEDDRLFLREDVTEPGVIKKWVENIDYDHILPILAFDGERCIGDATLHVERYGWWRHLGEIRLALARDFQRFGLGAAMAKEIYAAAQTRDIHKLMAEVLDSQTGAIRALEHLGFVTEALLKNHATDLKGNKHNLLIMTSDVDELWRRIEDAMLMADVRGSLHSH